MSEQKSICYDTETGELLHVGPRASKRDAPENKLDAFWFQYDELKEGGKLFGRKTAATVVRLDDPGEALMLELEECERRLEHTRKMRALEAGSEQ